MASMMRALVVAVLAFAMGADATFFYPVATPFIPGLYGAGYGVGSTVVVVSGHRKLLAANSTSCDTAAAVLDRTPELSTLKSLVGDLPAPLKEAATSTSGAEYTLFAPTDAAFNALFAMLPAGTATKLKANATAVGNLLSYHIVPGVAATAASLTNGQKLKTALKGGELTVEKTGSMVTIVGAGSKASVVKADVPVCHGIVHVIDEVLLPIKGRKEGKTRG